MKNIAKNFYISLTVSILCLFSITVEAQYYIRLQDASGFNTDQYQTDLNNAAHELVQAFPDTFQSRFKVFSCGFYVEQEFYDGFGYPEVFEKYRQQAAAQSDFYLLFGRESNSEGIYRRFWVDLKLPETGDFVCLDYLNPRKREDLILKIKFYINKEYDKSQNFPYQYHTAEKVAMDSLKSMIIGFVDCCDPGNRGATGCNACVLDATIIQDFFRGKGYVEIPIEIIESSTKDSAGQRFLPTYPRLNYCPGISSIKFADTLFANFPQIVSNIMSSFPDASSTAVITTDECMCNGGLEHEYEIMHDPPGVKLTFHLSRGPDYTNPIDDRMYFHILYPDALKTLPFRAHIPVNLSPDEIAKISLSEVMNTVITIFDKKNDFSLTSIDNIHVSNLTKYDIGNNLDNRNGAGNLGFSRADANTFDKEGNFVTTFYNLGNGKLQRSYIIGFALAHELIHQMVLKSFEKIELRVNWKDIYDSYGGHINNKKNLLVQGNISKEELLSSMQDLTTADRKSVTDAKIENYKVLFQQLIPSKNDENSYSDWERVADSHKFMIASYLFTDKCETLFGNPSSEFTCCKEILSTFVKKNLKFGMYEIYKR